MDVTTPTPLLHPQASFLSDAWASGHHRLVITWYVLAGLIGLFIVPVLFTIIDHTVVSQWANDILDLVSSP